MSRATNEPNIWLAGYKAGWKLTTVAFLAAALAGCGHAPIGADTGSASSLAPSRKTSLLTNNDAADVTKKHAAKVQGGSYGIASYYEYDSQTANGETFDPNGLTAAHRTLPFGTRVRVTNLTSGRSVVVRINDRGPFVPGRVIDVSYGAAKTLGIVDRGVAKVALHVIQ